MLRHRLHALLIAALLASLAACSSPLPGGGSGPPSCTDTSAAASQLARGCEKDGKTYKAIATHCVDGRTMYNVPSVPPHGASGFSGGRLRTHAISYEELVQCTTGSP